MVRLLRRERTAGGPWEVGRGDTLGEGVLMREGFRRDTTAVCVRDTEMVRPSRPPLDTLMDPL